MFAMFLLPSHRECNDTLVKMTQLHRKPHFRPKLLTQYFAHIGFCHLFINYTQLATLFYVRQILTSWDHMRYILQDVKFRTFCMFPVVIRSNVANPNEITQQTMSIQMTKA